MATGLCVPLQPLQIGADFGGVLVAKLAILFQTLVDDVFQFGRKVGVQPHRWRGRPVQNGFMVLKMTPELSPRKGDAPLALS